MKLVMLDENDKAIREFSNIQELNFDEPVNRKRILLFILSTIVDEQVGRWFDKDREREDPND